MTVVTFLGKKQAATETVFLPLKLILLLMKKNLRHTKGFNPSTNDRNDQQYKHVLYLQGHNK